ncbi:MAG TPA: DinB family protein [Vicinamibacterales bacterium]|nr:DinB family protein [Vicinamibacterales bacterium]
MGLQNDLRSREDIVAALTIAEHDVAAFFTSLTSEELASRVGAAWTASEQLAHLNIAVGAVAKGFAAPKLLLRLRFGRSRRPGLSYVELRDTYRARLAAGGRASAEFTPPAIDVAASSIETRRNDLLERWRRRNGRLRGAVSSWSEKQLDTIQIPHPLIGSISAREMLYFTIYHSEHHIAATKQRLPRFASDVS